MNPTEEYVQWICTLYGDWYDDREEDSRPGGENWAPGRKAAHKSIAAFQKELKDVYQIKLSRCKIQKILITGNRWTTERSREIEQLYEEYTSSVESGGKGMTQKDAIRAIAEHLGVSNVSVSINLPYSKIVYSLEEKSAGARRIEKWRKKKS